MKHRLSSTVAHSYLIGSDAIDRSSALLEHRAGI
jgi:hypothetical protein